MGRLAIGTCAKHRPGCRYCDPGAACLPLRWSGAHAALHYLQKQYQVGNSAANVDRVVITIINTIGYHTVWARQEGVGRGVAVGKETSLGNIAPLIPRRYFFQFFSQGLAVYLQNFGCPRFVASDTGQHILDVFNLDSRQRPVQARFVVD
jgi:hypothetical protein